MQKHSVHGPLLVLMAGLPGTGKTTLAAGLGAILRWPVLDKDVIKSSLMEVGLAEEAAGWAAFDAFFMLAQDVLVKQQLSVILDSSAMHPFIVERANEIARVAGVPLKVILCTAEASTRQRRLRARDDRNWRARVYYLIIDDEENRFVHLPADTLIVSTQAPFEEYLEQAIIYLTM